MPVLCCFAPSLNKGTVTSDEEDGGEGVKKRASGRTSSQEESNQDSAVAVVTAKASALPNKPHALNTDFIVELNEERDVVTPLHRGRKQNRSLSSGSPQTVHTSCDPASQQPTSSDRLQQLDPSMAHSPARSGVHSGLVRVTAADILTGAVNSSHAAGYRNNTQSPWMSGYALPLLTTTASNTGSPANAKSNDNHRHSSSVSAGSAQVPSPSSAGGGVTTPTSRPPLHPHTTPGPTPNPSDRRGSAPFSSPHAPRQPLIQHAGTTSATTPGPQQLSRGAANTTTPQPGKVSHLRGVSMSSIPMSTPSPHATNPYGFANVMLTQTRPRTAGSTHHTASARQHSGSPSGANGSLRVASKVGSASSRMALSGLLSRGSNMSASTDRGSTRSMTMQDFRPRWR